MWQWNYRAGWDATTTGTLHLTTDETYIYTITAAPSGSGPGIAKLSTSTFSGTHYQFTSLYSLNSIRLISDDLFYIFGVVTGLTSLRYAKYNLATNSFNWVSAITCSGSCSCYFATMLDSTDGTKTYYLNHVYDNRGHAMTFIAFAATGLSTGLR